MKNDAKYINPWLDIASYSINDANRFKGREKAIVKFSGIVNSGIMSVLYANSGIGKTSFLNAGIDPLMIQKGYIPIHIVFPDEMFSSNCTIEKWLMDNIRAQSQTEGREWKSRLGLTEDEQSRTKNILDKCSTSLWWMLHTHSLVDDEEKQYFPLLVFDQFEEVFVKSRKFGNSKFENKLFQLLEELSNSSLPPSLGDVPEKLADQDIFLVINHYANYKVIFSLRKEYLSDFDYWTQDRFSISELQQNRMLLLPLTRKQALRVITEQPSIENDGSNVETLNNIQDEIIHKLDPRNHNEVEPFMLSVLCSRLYEMAQKDKKDIITIEDLSKYDVETIILRFYEEKISQIIKDSRHLSRFENVLVDKDGSRNRVKIKELSSINFDSYQSALEKEHLIRKDTFNSDEVYVELIHDRIADAIKKKRIEGHKERARSFKVLSAAMLLIVTLLFLVGIPPQKTVDDCRSKTQPIDTIAYASTAVCDSVLELQNVHVRRLAFYANPFVKTIRIKSNVTLEDACFAFCPNLTKVIFDGDSISIGENVFSHCASLHTIQITNIAHFLLVGELIDVPQMSQFIVPKNHKQCEVDALGKTIRIDNVIWNQYAEVGGYSSECYIPEGWEQYLRSSFFYRENLKWCKSITSDQINQHDYNKDSIYYLVDTISELPSFDSDARSFLRKNVVYVSLSDVKEIKASLFSESKIQKIDIPYVESIRAGAFAFSQLCYINAPNVRVIEECAFNGTHNLQKHIRFNSLDSIGSRAFSGDSIVKLVMPHLRSAASNALSYLYVDTILLPSLLFSMDNSCCGVDFSDKIVSPPFNEMVAVYRHSKGLYRLETPQDCLDDNINLSNYDSLYIGEDMAELKEIVNYSNLENISVSLLNPTYFSYKNILFQKKGDWYRPILNAPNQRRIFVYSDNFNANVQVGDKTREIVLLFPNMHTCISCSEEQKKNITIYFPYMAEDYIRNLAKTNEFNGYKDVVEMSYLRTSYYNLAFRLVMNNHYSNYRIPLCLLVVFILCIYMNIKRNFKSSNIKTKLMFLVSYTLLSAAGLYVIVSSTLLAEEVPTMQFHLVLLWFFIASSFALWITYPHYPNKSLLKDALEFLLWAPIFLVAVIWNHNLSTPKLFGIDKKWWTVIMLSVFVLSLIAYTILQKKDKVILDNYLLMHRNRRGLLIFLYYAYFVEMFSCTAASAEGTAFEYESILGMMLLVVAMCSGFCIAHWRIRKRMNFNYAAYFKMREQLKYQQSIPFGSDSVLKQRIHFCLIFAVVSIVIVCVWGLLCYYSYDTASYIMLCFMALQPILIHVCLHNMDISYSDLIRQYAQEFRLMQECNQTSKS